MATARIAHQTGDYQKLSARLLEIDRLLREGGYPSHAQLAGHLGVSSRTIVRDFAHLRYTLKAPLAYDGSRKGWHYSEASYFLPAMVATATDVLSLLLVREAVEQYAGTPHAEAARAALDKIEAALPPSARTAAAWAKTKVAFTDFPAAAIQPTVWQAVLGALQHSRTLRLQYAKPGERVRWREVDPWGLVVSEGDWYLHGFCHTRQAPRTFLLPRARAAEVTERRFETPADFDLRAYVHHGFAGLQADGAPELAYRIRFTRKASPLAAERKWHVHQQESWDSRRRLTLTIRTSAGFRVMRKVAEWGGGVEKVETRGD